MHVFLSAFDDIPDPRAENTRHELGELLVIAFVSVLCGATSCAEMAAFGRAKESVFRSFLKLKHAILSHDTFSAVFRMLDPKALDRRCCRTLIAENSNRESMRLEGLDVEAIPRPLPHDELVQLHCGASQARVSADLAGQGDDLARAA